MNHARPLPTPSGPPSLPQAKPLPGSLETPLLRPVAPLPTGLGAIDALLPEGGLPRGAVTELASFQGLGLSTTLALAACRSAQSEARMRGGESAWCAFLDPTQSLYAPGVQAQGVELERLLVIRPPQDALAKVAVRVVSSRAFSVVVIDTGGVPGSGGSGGLALWAAVTRRLALAAEGTDTAVVLLTHREAHRPLPLPVALRLELAQQSRTTLLLRVARDRHGQVGDWRSAVLGPAGPAKSAAPSVNQESLPLDLAVLPPRASP